MLNFNLIIYKRFFCGLFAYFVAGFVFLKFVRKNTGKETIPNHTFWISLPNNVKVNQFLNLIFT